MGLLTLGTPLSWPETQALSAHVREHGITQLLSLWRKVKDRRGDAPLWGDEIEYIVASLDEEDRNARLSLRQGEILKVLAVSHEQSCKQVEQEEEDGDEDDEDQAGASKADQIPTFHPEYGRYMLESTPGCPYGASPAQLSSVEGNMRMRRRIAKRHLLPNELPLTLTSFPRLGVNDHPFLDDKSLVPNGKASQSLFLPDEIINQHVRFPTLTANIRSRRGSKVAINLPIYKDVHTPSPFIDPTIPWDRNLFPGDSEAKNGAAKPDHIYMDSMGFGMGCCCLQVTFQACSVTDARATYDQLVPVTPILLALSAAAPAYRGYLADVDARWSVISGAVDDRTHEERGEGESKTHQQQPGPNGNTSTRMYKSRYDSVSSYLSLSPLSRPDVYNDIPLPIHQPTYDRLVAPVEQGGGGMDSLLARHFAHLFTRDPLVIFSEGINQDDQDSMDHFENIQSTNWQTMRFKPPPPHSNIGWRVEVRSMEVQVTDFENAAFSVFVVLLTRAILRFGLNFYIPLSKVDDNMERAQKRDAVLKEKFWFRKDVLGAGRERSGASKETVEVRHQSGDPNGNRNDNSNNGDGQRSTMIGPGPRAHPRVMYGVDSTWTTPASSRASSPAGAKVSGPSPSTSAPPLKLGEEKASRSSNGFCNDVAEEYSRFSVDELINGTTAARHRQATDPSSAATSSSSLASSTTTSTSTSTSASASASNLNAPAPAPEFPGLLSLIHDYLDSLPSLQSPCSRTRKQLNLYLSLISDRASGRLVTAASYIRSFVTSHPEYKKDSFISKEVCFDLVRHLDDVERGEVDAVGFLPPGYAERRKELERKDVESPTRGGGGDVGGSGAGGGDGGGMIDAANQAVKVVEDDLRNDHLRNANPVPAGTGGGGEKINDQEVQERLKALSSRGGKDGNSVRSGDRMKEEKDLLLS